MIHFVLVGLVSQRSRFRFPPWSGKLFSLPGVDAHSEKPQTSYSPEYITPTNTKSNLIDKPCFSKNALVFSHNNIHIKSAPEGNSFILPRVSKFSETKSRETLRLAGKQIPEGTNIKCFVI